MPPARLPRYVKAQPNPSGGVRYYFRYRGVYRLPGGPESAEFYGLGGGLHLPDFDFCQRTRWIDEQAERSFTWYYLVEQLDLF